MANVVVRSRVVDTVNGAVDNGAGRLNVAAASLPLPTGGATSAAQATLEAAVAKAAAQTDGSQLARAMGVDDAAAQRQVRLDSILGTLVPMSFIQHAVNLGQMFHATNVSTNVDIITPKYYLLRAPAGTEWHVRFGVSALTAAQVALLEVPDLATDGTGILLANMRRGAGDVLAGASWLFQDPTFNAGDDGDLLMEEYCGAAAGAALQPGNIGKDAEWILAAGVEYIIRVTSIADDNIVTLNIQMYDALAL